jgi:hypothetical protein
MNNLFQFIEKTIGRRAFLQRLTTMTGAFFAGVLGLPEPAFGCTNACCNLCLQTDATCSETRCKSFASHKCYWQWMCNDDTGPNRTCKRYECSECFAVLPPNCTLALCEANHNICRACTFQGVLCSRARPVQVIPGCTSTG